MNVNEFMTLYIYNEIFVDGCYDIQISNKKNPVIIDVGANTGLFITRMKQLYPGAKVFGYEPMPNNYRQLEKNLKDGGFTDYDICMKGIGGTARREKLYIHEKNLGGHSIYNSQASGNDSIEIELISVTDALKPLNGKNCDFLKLDCEGAEHEIIKSLDERTAKRIHVIVFEATPTLYEIGELVNHLEAIGYKVNSWNGLYVCNHVGVVDHSRSPEEAADADMESK